MRINQPKIKAEICEIEKDIKEYKALRKKPPGGWPCNGELIARDMATFRYSIQAHRRGKIHLSQRFKALEEQFNFIKLWLPDYEIIEPTVETVTEG